MSLSDGSILGFIPLPRFQGIHPLAGMKTVPLRGDERRFELSEAAQQRRAWEKKAKANYVHPGVAEREGKRWYKKHKTLGGPL